MSSFDSTCWTLIRDAARGDLSARSRFACVYLPVVNAYLAARWRDRIRQSDADDAIQEVFVECFKTGGLLEKVDENRAGGFRAFILGAVRNVARRFEVQGRVVAQLPPGLPAADTGPAEAFDRAWARALMREAACTQQESASRTDPAALRRVELLRLRFQEGLPIRAIAKRWEENVEKLHREYAIARKEFRAALRNVVAFYHPRATSTEIDRICQELLDLLK
jgi:RNA polymerase sigma-70 factor (ECF subfamily)